MAIKETLKLSGEVTITTTHIDGSTDVVVHKNLVVNTGLAFMAARMKDASVAPMSHMAVGSGTTPTAGTDIALVTELGRSAFGTVDLLNNKITYNASFPPGVATGAISEAGVLNAAAAGAMLCRTVFPVVNKLEADSVNLAWAVTIIAA